MGLFWHAAQQREVVICWRAPIPPAAKLLSKRLAANFLTHIDCTPKSLYTCLANAKPNLAQMEVHFMMVEGRVHVIFLFKFTTTVKSKGN